MLANLSAKTLSAVLAAAVAGAGLALAAGAWAGVAASTLAALAAMIGLGLGAAIYTSVNASLAAPAARLAKASARLAAGDCETRIEGFAAETEAGAIAAEVERLRETILELQRRIEDSGAAEAASASRRAARDGMQKELRRVIEAALKGDFSQRVTATYEDPEVHETASQVSRLVESVETGLQECGRVIEKLAEGDLSAQMKGFDQGAFGALQADMNKSMRRLAGMVREIKRSSASTAASTDRIADGAQQLSARAESQAAALQETSATLEEMSASIQTNASSATQAETAAREAASRASRGSSVVAEAVGAVEQLEASSGKISEIINVIESIAFQTNLLALNAAVEAARAGDAGKGFAVVASEVRSLAQRSSEAAKDITGLIQESSSHVADGARLVRSTGDALSEINAAIEDAVANIDGISAASNQQATGMKEIAAAVTSMDEITQQNAALAEQSASSARSLATDAGELRQLVGFFRGVGGDEVDATEDQADRAWRAASSAAPQPAPKPAAKSASAPKPAPKSAPKSAAQPAAKPAPAASASAAKPAPAPKAAPAAALATVEDDEAWAEF